ncbi:MAG: translocation/assembly module TamB domain-containing protein [Rikenellaceae bacterium]
MGKVIKILGKLAATTILLLIISPIIAALLLTIPQVQRSVVNFTTSIASKHLGSRVAIERIDLWPIYTVNVKGFYVEDHQGDTLLYVKDVATRITDFSRTNLTFGPTKVRGAKFNIIEGADSILNIKSVLEPIMPENPKGTFEILFASIDMNESRFSFQKLDKRNPEQGMDYGDICFDNLTTHIDAMRILGARVTGQVKTLSGDEKGGGRVDNVTGELVVNRGEISLFNTMVDFGSSHGEFDYLILSADEWQDYSDFIHEVRIEAQLNSGDISMSDICHFAPETIGMSLVGHDMALQVDGTVDNLKVNVEKFNFFEGSSFRGDVEIIGLPDFRESFYNIDIKSLRSNAKELNATLTGVKVEPLDSNIEQMVSRTKEIRVEGKLRGRLDNLSINTAVASAIGRVNVDMLLTSNADSRTVDLSLNSSQLELGTLLDVSSLGSAALNTKISVKDIGDPSKQSIVVDGSSAQINFNDYPYSSINYEATIQNGRYVANVDSYDPNANFNLWADIDLGSQQSSYDVNLNIKYCDLHELKINQRDSISAIHGNLKAHIIGSSIDDVEGHIDIENGLYYFNADTISCERISTVAYLNQEDRGVSIDSELFTLNYNTQATHSQIISYAKSSLHRYLPVLYPADYKPYRLPSEQTQTTLEVKIGDNEDFTKAIDPTLSMAGDSQLTLSLEPHTNKFSINAHSSFIEWGSLLSLRPTLNASNIDDELNFEVTSSSLYMGMTKFDGLLATAEVADDNIALKVSYCDQDGETLGVIDTSSNLNRNDSDKIDIDIEFNPSYITYDGDRWEISTQELAMLDGALNIDNFIIRNGAQYLTVNGVASSAISDMITIHLKSFDLGMLTQFTEGIGYQVEGVTSGFASINSALGSSRIEASIDMDSVALNRIPSPPLRLSAQWNSELNRAGVSVFKREKSDGGAVTMADTLMRGYYRPSDAAYFALINIDSIDIGVIDPLLNGVLSDSHGYASTALELRGKRQDISLAGEILVEDMSTRVEFTNVTYKLNSAVINVEDSKFEANRVTITDPKGGEALMTLRFDISKLNNVNYNVRIVPTNLMVLNTTEDDNELFYGTVFASGSVLISGDKAGVDMNIAAKTESHSEFYMPLSNKSNASTAEFIKFVEPDKVIDSLSYIISRRISFENTKRANSEGAGLSISMALEVTPNAEVQIVIDPVVGDIIKGRGEGRLNIEINPKANKFEMYGDYSITEGNYLFTLQNIVNKRFKIDSGSTIQWTGDPLDATLNIMALYELKTSLQPLIGDTSSDETWRSVPVECVIHLTDRLTKPDVEFAIELPDSDVEQQTIVANILNDQETISRQFFYLMIANSFISESSSNSIASIGSTSTAATTGFELLTNQLSNWLSSSDYSIILRYRPDSELTGDELDVGFSKGWIDNRLLIEVEGNYVSDYNGAINEVSNIMGEAYVTWLIDKEGALKIRAFSQTIDRFDENQGLQETGVGIYYSERFNNLADLRKKVRDRFNFKARRRERKERAAATLANLDKSKESTTTEQTTSAE